MNIENLSKSQLLLLTILVNFVVSIATGIVTVSLLDEASPTITQTVNRIVERTVETVAPQSQVAASVITREKTVVVKEEDLVISAIAASSARTVTLHVGTAAANPFSIGVYLPNTRAAITVGNGNGPSEIAVKFADGTSAEASLEGAKGGVELYGFSDTVTLPEAPVPALVPAKSLKAGQSVFSIAADGGVVTGIVSLAAGDTIRTTLPALPKGAAIVNASGDVIGLAKGEAGGIISADVVIGLLSATSTPSSSLSL